MSSLPPSFEILQTSEKPPTAFTPIAKTVNKPPIVKNNWIVSVQTTALTPPFMIMIIYNKILTHLLRTIIALLLELNFYHGCIRYTNKTEDRRYQMNAISCNLRKSQCRDINYYRYI